MNRLLLITDEDELPALKQLLTAAEPAVRIDHVDNLDALDQATRSPAGNLRVLAFLSPVILPARILDRLPGPAYNFHPGPPEVRGLFPAVFAVYHGVTNFGATAHEIVPEIDAGPIIGVARRAIPPDIDRFNLETLSRKLVMVLFARLAPLLIKQAEPLPHSGERWSGQVWTSRDFEALCRVPFDADEETFERHYRAVGEGPDHAIKLERFGRTFSLDPLENAGPVMKGGRLIGGRG